jgi:hypothetical protein
MAILTNATNSNSGWEVAGGKKNTRKSPDLKNKSKNNSTDLTAKMPKIENLAPLQLKGSIYDNLRESDDSSDEIEMDALNNNRVIKKLQSDVRMPSLIQTELKQKSATASPKAQQKNSNKPQAETLNLLQTSIASNKKKVTSPSAGKNVQVEFEKAVAQVQNYFFPSHINFIRLVEHFFFSFS